ncbi:MAG TPA: type II toxin-antitoxin system VapC family toxin [Chloroflexota bacterium]|nr:type II toxin-antitoxin system VapC family toxin [Chloroflexota bacterium]
MKVLLDTCALIWATLSPSTLSADARETIADEGNEILVSAATAWEIATKVRLGKLPGAEKLDRDYLAVIEDAGYTTLVIEAESALRAGRLVADHRDPFDRMIAAQALALDIPVISPDTQLDPFGIRRIW